MPQDQTMELDTDDPMVEAVEVPMSTANCCFTGVETVAGAYLVGENFLERPHLACTAGDKVFGGTKKTNVTEKYWK